MSGEPYRIALRPDQPDTPDVLDDVVVNEVSMFRAEMMDKRSLWMACYFPDSDQQLTFWVQAKGGRLVLRVAEMPAESETFTYEEQR